MKYLKILILFFTVYILVGSTIYFSLHEYADTQSASCLRCPFIKDVLFFSFFSTVTTSTLYFIFRRVIKKEKPVIFATILVFLFTICFSNYLIFVDRVSSWSSFSFSGELMGVFSESYLYLIGSSIVLYFFFKKLNAISECSNTSVK